MDAVTYPKETVIRLVNQYFVPLKIDASQQTGLSKIFRVEVTPSFVATDARQKQFHTASGFYPPGEFQELLLLMRAAADLEKRSYDSAIELLSKIVDEAFHSIAAPEALYMLGVARYKKSGDFQEAVEQWRRLKLSFPNHPLIKKVDYAL